MNEVVVRFSRHIRELREKNNLSQQDLSECANIEYKHVQRLESKHPCDVKLTTLDKLAKAFKISLAKLMDF